LNRAVIRVQDNAMSPLYCQDDVVIYQRPQDGMDLKPGDDVLILLVGPAGNLQLHIRRLAYWDEEELLLLALNTTHPPIHKHPRNAVLCGQVIGLLS